MYEFSMYILAYGVSHEIHIGGIARKKTNFPPHFYFYFLFRKEVNQLLRDKKVIHTLYFVI